MCHGFSLNNYDVKQTISFLVYKGLFSYQKFKKINKMGGILSSSKSDELLEYKPFIKLAEKVMDENGKDLEALEKCVNDVDAGNSLYFCCFF